MLAIRSSPTSVYKNSDSEIPMSTVRHKGPEGCWLTRFVEKILPKKTNSSVFVTHMHRTALNICNFIHRVSEAVSDCIAEGKEISDYIWTRLFPSKRDDEKHFRIDDIQRMAKKAIGLRHVSHDDLAWHEWSHGIKDGCAFNLTFQKSEHSAAHGFERLPEELMSSSITEKEKREKIVSYEAAVDAHIAQSLIMDLPFRIELGKTRVRDVIEALRYTSFLMIDYSGFYRPTDFSQYSGLGRFPKANLDKERVKHLILRNVPDPNIEKQNMRVVIKTKAQGERVFNKIVETVRVAILARIRMQGFDERFMDRVLS